MDDIKETKYFSAFFFVFPPDEFGELLHTHRKWAEEWKRMGNGEFSSYLPSPTSKIQTLKNLQIPPFNPLLIGLKHETTP
jgi:hypothetical protein